MPVSSPSRKRRKVINPSRGIQLDFLSTLFPEQNAIACHSLVPKKPSYTETEKLLYLLWDGMKRQNQEQFLDANRNCAYYLTGEQYSALLKEVTDRATFNDRVWLLKITPGARSVLSFVYPFHHQHHAIFNGGDFFLFCSIVYFFLLWDNK